MQAIGGGRALCHLPRCNRGKFPRAARSVIAGLVPAIHAVVSERSSNVEHWPRQDVDRTDLFQAARFAALNRVDGRNEPGHDELPGETAPILPRFRKPLGLRGLAVWP